MDLGIKGTIVKLQAVKSGDFFVFRPGDKLALGMKISSTLLDDPRQILMFNLAGSTDSVRIFDHTRAQTPSFVYCLPAKIVIDPMPENLRAGVPNPEVGKIYISETGSLICAHDTSHNDHDPTFVDLETGDIRGLLKDNAAVHSKWRIVVKEGDREIDLLTIPQPKAAGMVG